MHVVSEKKYFPNLIPFISVVCAKLEAQMSLYRSPDITKSS